MKQSIFSRYLLAISIGHFSLGLMIFYSSFLGVLQEGWWNQIGPNNLETAVAFWFIIFTWPSMMLVINMWSQQSPVGTKFLLFALIMSLVSATAMPISGFWFFTLLCMAALIMNKRSHA